MNEVDSTYAIQTCTLHMVAQGFLHSPENMSVQERVERINVWGHIQLLCSIGLNSVLMQDSAEPFTLLSLVRRWPMLP